MQVGMYHARPASAVVGIDREDLFSVTAPRDPIGSVRMSEAERLLQGTGLRPAAGQSNLSKPSAQDGATAVRFLFLYMWLDLVRPSFVWHFPKLLSTALFVTWLMQSEKRLPRQNLLMLLFLGVMVIDIPIAQNSFAAVWTSYGMAVLFLGLCLPLVQFINSLSRFRNLIHTWMAICVVIGAWGAFHNGYGPAGAAGGQDENYVTACMAMAIPLFLYSSLSAETKLKKMLFLAPIPILLLAVVMAANPSRGGFIGIICTIAYMVYYSKKRVMAFAAVGVLAAMIGLLAGPAYWSEIRTTTDTDSGTADHRTDLWRIATYMFMSYPLTGIGPNNYRWRIEEFETDEIIQKYGHSLGGTAFTHSLYFELLAELGAAGVVIFALMVLRNFKDLGEIKRRAQEAIAAASREAKDGAIAGHLAPMETLKLVHCYAQGITASFIAFLVCSAFVSTLYYSYFWLYSALIATFKLVVDQALLQQPGMMFADVMRNPKATQVRNRGA